MAYGFLSFFDPLCAVVRLTRYHFGPRRYVVLFVIMNTAPCCQHDFVIDILLLPLLLLFTVQPSVCLGLFNSSIALLSILYLRPPTNNFHPL
jgi:hypothetical protein